MEQILLTGLPIIFISGLLFILNSNPASIIEKSSYSDVLDNSPFYGIKHIRKVINLSSNPSTVKRLKQKIQLRKIGYGLLISVPVLIILKSALNQ